MGTAIGYVQVRAAVPMLLALGPERLRALKVTSGEHLAALLLTAFVRKAPVALDTDGGVDLVFDVPSNVPTGGLFPPGQRMAVEVKSVPGPFREVASYIHRTDDLGAGIMIKPSSSTDILKGAKSLIDAAATKLRDHADAALRYAFLVVHPFDQLADDVARHPLAASVLEPPELPDGLDGLFVLWVPDQLTAWSAATDCWWQLIFELFDPDNPPERNDPELAFLQEVESDLMSAMGYRGATPYLFGVDPDLGERRT